MEIPGGLVVPFVTRDSLLAMKRLAGRQQDLADIATLEEIQRISENKM